MSQKGFSAAFLVVIVALLGVGGAGVWYFTHRPETGASIKTQTAKSCNVDQSHIGKMHYVQSNINACVPNGWTLTQFRDGNFTSGSTSYDKRVNSKVIAQNGGKDGPFTLSGSVKTPADFAGFDRFIDTKKITPSQDGFVSFEYDTQKDDPVGAGIAPLPEGTQQYEFVRTFAGTNVFFSVHYNAEPGKTNDKALVESFTRSLNYKPITDGAYLTIKEWGVRLPLSAKIADATYKMVTIPDGQYVALNTKALSATACGKGDAAAGALIRQTIKEHDANVAAGPEDINNVIAPYKVGDYYYRLTIPNGGCDDSQKNIDLRAKIIDAFYLSAADIKPAK